MTQDDHAIAISLLLADGCKTPADVRITPVTSGFSGAGVYRIVEGDRGTRYLKIGRDNNAAALRDEIARMAWLAAHGIRVPRVLQADHGIGRCAVLMDAVAGTPAEKARLPVMQMADALGRGFAALHALPVAECPFDESLDVRLDRAAAAVASGDVDPDAFDERNQGIAPEALLARLQAAQPPEDIVVVHGDATLSNIMVSDDGTPGFVDCGNAGRGDRYLDLAVLSDDIAGQYGDEAAARFRSAYGIRDWDDSKAGFYLDLYELF